MVRDRRGKPNHVVPDAQAQSPPVTRKISDLKRRALECNLNSAANVCAHIAGAIAVEEAHSCSCGNYDVIPLTGLMNFSSNRAFPGQRKRSDSPGCWHPYSKIKRTENQVAHLPPLTGGTDVTAQRSS